MGEIIALAAKDLRLLLRDKAGFFFTFFFPLLIAIFFGTIFSGDGGDSSAMTILVVDEDQTVPSKEFVVLLQSAPEIRVELSDRANAVEQVRRGRRVAYILLKPGFGAARERVFWGEPPEIELGVDPARRAEAGMLTGILTKYAAQGMQELFSNSQKMRKQVHTALDAARGLPEETAASLTQFLRELDRFVADTTVTADGSLQNFEPVAIKETAIMRKRTGPPNAYAISFPQGIIWGIIGCAAAFAISLVTERTRGTLVRIRTAPVASIQILAGKALACFVTTLAVAVVLLGLAALVFGVRPTSVSLLAVGILVIAIGFVGIMMLLSVLGRTEQAASGIGWAIMLVLAMLGGGMIPLFVMPSWMQSVSHVSPVKWAILILEGAIWRNFSMQDMLLPFAVVLSFGGICFALGVKMFRWSETG